MTAISYHHTLADVQAIDLAPRGPFGRKEWFAALEAAGHRPLYAVAEDASGGIVFPLRRAGRRLEAMLGRQASTWRPLGTAYASADSLSIALARDLSRRASVVVLDRVPDEDGTARQLERAFARSGWLVAREPCIASRVIEVAGRTFADIRAHQPDPDPAEPVDIAIHAAFDADAWAACATLGSGDLAPMRAFAEAEGEAGRLRLGLARRAGEAVAAQVWSIEDGAAHLHAHSADCHAAPDRLTAAMMERAIDGDGARWIDFGPGDPAIARTWAREARPRFRLRAWRKGDPRNWPAIGRLKFRTLVSRPAPG